MDGCAAAAGRCSASGPRGWGRSRAGRQSPRAYDAPSWKAVFCTRNPTEPPKPLARLGSRRPWLFRQILLVQIATSPLRIPPKPRPFRAAGFIRYRERHRLSCHCKMPSLSSLLGQRRSGALTQRPRLRLRTPGRQRPWPRDWLPPRCPPNAEQRLRLAAQPRGDQSGPPSRASIQGLHPGPPSRASDTPTSDRNTVSGLLTAHSSGRCTQPQSARAPGIGLLAEWLNCGTQSQSVTVTARPQVSMEHSTEGRTGVLVVLDVGVSERPHAPAPCGSAYHATTSPAQFDEVIRGTTRGNSWGGDDERDREREREGFLIRNLPENGAQMGRTASRIPSSILHQTPASSCRCSVRTIDACTPSSGDGL
jgi:hypothetical protein